MDCDARTLRGRSDVMEYGRLLLEVGRLGGGSPAPLVAFSEPRSFLEQRITAMTTSRTDRLSSQAASRAR